MAVTSGRESTSDRLPLDMAAPWSVFCDSWTKTARPHWTPVLRPEQFCARHATRRGATTRRMGNALAWSRRAHRSYRHSALYRLRTTAHRSETPRPARPT